MQTLIKHTVIWGLTLTFATCIGTNFAAHSISSDKMDPAISTEIAYNLVQQTLNASAANDDAQWVKSMADYIYSNMKGIAAPESVVRRWLYYHAISNYDAWLMTMTERKQKGFSKETNGISGVISMAIHSIEKSNDDRRLNDLFKSERYQALNLTKDDIIIVDTFFTVEYDNSLVPTNSGDIRWSFILIRENADSPWLIMDYGYGY